MRNAIERSKMRMRLFIIALVAMLSVASTSRAFAEDDTATLRKELDALKERLDAQDDEIKYLKLKVAKEELTRVTQTGQEEKEPVKGITRGEVEAEVKDYLGSEEFVHEYEKAYPGKVEEEVVKKTVREVVEAQVKDYLGTEEFVHEYEKVYPSKVKAEYKIGEGFNFETLDKRFLLEIIGRLQTRYDYRFKEDGSDTSSFTINRLRLLFHGHAFTPNLHYTTEVELRQSGLNQSGIPQLKEAYLTYHFFPELHLQGGQWKVPYNRQFMASDFRKQLIDTSIVTKAFNLDRDIGFMLNGAPFNERLEYYAAIFSGRGINSTESSSNKNLIVARLGYRPFGRFNDYWETDVEYNKHFKAALGIAFATNSGTQIFVDDKLQTFPEDAQFKQYGIDSIMKFRGFSLQGEFHLRTLDRPVLGESTAKGFFVQAGYFPIPKRLEFAGRYAQVDPNVSVSHDLQREFTFGPNWYFSEHHHNKLQANVSHFITEIPNGNDKRDTVLSLMHQIEW